MDAIPAKINLSQSIITLKKGQYRGFCFELCGNGHTSMLLTSNVIINCYLFIYYFLLPYYQLYIELMDWNLKQLKH